MCLKTNHLWLAPCILVCSITAPTAAETVSKEQAARALRQAVSFFRTQVSVEGGYLWRYSADLARREGEGVASATTAWVQPPGTPSVGMAFLDVHRLTQDPYYLEAAQETAYALVNGQLEAGGWDYRIEFDPLRRRRYAYRADGQQRGDRNEVTLDDDTTQSALQFLMQLDQALEFQDARIHECVEYALQRLLKAQYPNGAWPQRFSASPDPDQYPVLKASYPDSWSRTHVKQDYRGYYTFNDNTIADTIGVMFTAARVYRDARYRQAAERGGDFIILAQMPEPQPAWAQQYDANMHPAWARRFEPPAITGGESQGVMRTLLSLYRETGDRKYLNPLPAALEYLKQSRLPDGRLARFYELHTNRPLYFTKQYELTYRDNDLPTHYGFVVSSSLDAIEGEYQRMLKLDAEQLKPSPDSEPPRMSPSLARQAEAVIDSMDARGAWVEAGRLQYHGDDDPTREVIDARTFVSHILVLARFLAAQ